MRSGLAGLQFLARRAFGARAVRGQEFPIKTNALYYGDNREILREYFLDESVDLIYLDPPFNSKQSYNVIFKDESGRSSDAQILAFEDTWHWGKRSEETYAYLTETGRHHGQVPDTVSTIIAALRSALGGDYEDQIMAYLVEMTVRLVDLRRVLKPTGSLFLHCDPTASHYLKIVLDAIFGPASFRNEVIWRYRRWPTKSRQFQKMHDVLLYYSKSDKGTHEFETLYGYEKLAESTLKTFGTKKQVADFSSGHRKPGTEAKESVGPPLSDVWEIGIIAPIGKERMGYPTQKPEALLERIIKATTKPGEVVLDPFCGCGTAVAVAQRLGRRWVGIDVTYLAIGVMRTRLKRDFQLENVEVIGQPTEVEGARQMSIAPNGRYQFQWWALDKLGAQPVSGTQRKGADRGIDGRITFTSEGGGMGSVLISVKSGHVTPAQVRDLKGTLEREYAPMGIFLTLEEPTREMRREAATAGAYRIRERDYPKIQIITVRELLEGHQKPLLPPLVLTTDERTGRARGPMGQQLTLDDVLVEPHLKAAVVPPSRSKSRTGT